MTACAGVAALVSYRLQGQTGLVGVLVGVVVAYVLCGASHAALERVRTVHPRLLPGAMLLGAFLSFVFMAAFVFVIASVKREILVASTLTALSMYLVYRFVAAFEISRTASRSLASGAGSSPTEGAE